METGNTHVGADALVRQRSEAPQFLRRAMLARPDEGVRAYAGGDVTSIV